MHSFQKVKTVISNHMWQDRCLCAIFKPHPRRWYLGSLDCGLPYFLYFTCGIYENVRNICTSHHSCHSKTLSCEQPAASHYAKSNKTVELSLVSQSNISKYSLTTHIGEDLEVCLCLDIKHSGWGNYRHKIPCLLREVNKHLPKPQIHQIWKKIQESAFFLILYGDVHLCVRAHVCVLCIRSRDLCCSKQLLQLISVKQEQHSCAFQKKVMFVLYSDVFQVLA